MRWSADDSVELHVTGVADEVESVTRRLAAGLASSGYRLAKTPRTGSRHPLGCWPPRQGSDSPVAWPKHCGVLPCSSVAVLITCREKLARSDPSNRARNRSDGGSKKGHRRLAFQ